MALRDILVDHRELRGAAGTKMTVITVLGGHGGFSVLPSPPERKAVLVGQAGQAGRSGQSGWAGRAGSRAASWQMQRHRHPAGGTCSGVPADLGLEAGAHGRRIARTVSLVMARASSAAAARLDATKMWALARMRPNQHSQKNILDAETLFRSACVYSTPIFVCMVMPGGCETNSGAVPLHKDLFLRTAPCIQNYGIM